jgi:hypothetical protein
LRGAFVTPGSKAWKSCHLDDSAIQATLAWSRSSASSDMISAAGRGALNRKPCTAVQPSARSRSSCSRVSTPSAVVEMPRLAPSLRTTAGT